MKYNIRGNKIEVTDSIKDYLEEKLSKIEKYFDDEGAEVKAVISTKGKDQKIEVTIWSGKYNIRVEEKNDDLYAAIDLIVDKIERQIRKFKTKVISKRVKDIPEAEMFFEDDLDTQNDLKVVRRKELFLKPIDEEEAITQMELLGHSFFVFKDVDSNKTCVIYKRKDGDYGLIEVN